MIGIRRILQDYRETGALNSLLALWGFIDEHTFLTKAGDLGVVYRVRGADFECLDHADRQAIARRFEQALRQLDESFRVYEYVIKQPAGPIVAAGHPHAVVNEALERRAEYLTAKADALFEFDLFLVVLFESRVVGHGAGWLRAPLTTLRERLSTAATTHILSDELTQARATLHQKAQAFAVQLADTIQPVMLAKQEAFTFFRRLLNYTPWKVDGVSLKYDTHLDSTSPTPRWNAIATISPSMTRA